MNKNERETQVVDFLKKNNSQAFTATEIALRLGEKRKPVKQTLVNLSKEGRINKSTPKNPPVATYYYIGSARNIVNFDSEVTIVDEQGEKNPIKVVA